MKKKKARNVRRKPPRKRASPPGAYLSLRKYAEHRKAKGLPGGTHRAVSIAITEQRLVNSVEYDPKGRAKIVDPELADQEWSENTTATLQRDPAEASAGVKAAQDEKRDLYGDLEPREKKEPARGRAGIPRVLRDANLREATYKAQMTELRFRHMAGELLERAEVERVAFTIARELRDGLTAIGARVQNQVAAETNPHKCRLIYDHELRRALEDLDGKLGELLEPRSKKRRRGA